ncbi:MAG: PHB depolymerase family esterase [Puniceicoccaceae bacterium]
MRIVGCALTVLALSICADAAPETRLPWEQAQFFHDGVVRQYRYWVPDASESACAVLILLHDADENLQTVFDRSSAANRRWQQLAQSEGFILLVPNGTDLRTGKGRGQRLHWNDCRPNNERRHRSSVSDDVAFLREVIERVAREHHVDASRIYATGAGEGGLMAMRLAFEAPDIVAAVSSIHATLPFNTDCERSRVPVPMLLINSTQDSRFRWNGGNLGERHGLMMAVPRMRKLLIAYNWAREDEARHETRPDHDPADGCTVERMWVPGSERGADVCFYTIEGGGHALPSRVHGLSERDVARIGPQCRDIEMVDESWQFLRNYTLAADE